MKKIIYILSFIVLLLGSSSCSDFLQKDPTSSPSESIFWQSKSDFDSGLAACYSLVYSWPGVMSEIISCFDNLTDNSICQYDEDTYGKTKTIALGDLTSNTSGFVSYMYNDCYRGIARTNLVMGKLSAYTGTEMTDSEKSRMMAECKALRGYYYSWLYLCYRQVPLVTKTLDLNDMYQEKAPRSEIYNQIMSDYNDAIKNLPDEVYSNSDVSGHMTVSAVKVLKARILLNDAYDDSGNATNTANLDSVVSILTSIKGYSLASSMRDNFVRDKQSSSSEIIFSVRYLEPNITNSIDLRFGAWATDQVTRDFINEFEFTDGKKWGESSMTPIVNDSLIESGSNTNALARAERAKLFVNRDPRLKQTVSQSNLLIFSDKGYEDANATNDGSQTHFFMTKLVQPTTTVPNYSTVSDADVVIIRYAEVLLSIAEAENELNGPDATVYNAVNAVRTRSGMPALPENLTKEEMRSRIRHEWRVEFAFEGQRYFQLKRWKLMGTLVNGAEDPAIPTYIKVFKDAFYYWPIPQTEIDKANGVLTQDPNYK
jgi:starch-binding outer membrane protein, SusD/RagB family